jgi:hypothetical protein
MFEMRSTKFKASDTLFAKQNPLGDGTADSILAHERPKKLKFKWG